MRNYMKEIVLLVFLLSWLQLSAEGKPRPARCSQTSEIELYYHTDPGAEVECIKCPKCPEGQGLSRQCGSRVPNSTKIECIQCQANVSYSNSHGIESCRACQDCGLRNVIQHCTPDKNRICGTECPQGYFLDDNHICQECYFCCGSVSEAQRRQGCKDIGMSRDRQCEKTEQNQRCWEALKKVTTKPTRPKPTADTAPHGHNTMIKKHFQPQGHDNATSIAHLPTKSLTGSKSMQGGSTPITSHVGKVAVSPTNGDFRSATRRTERENRQEEHGPVFLGPVMGGVVSVVIISAFVLVTLKKGIRKYFSRTNNSETADSTEWIPLSTHEPTDSGRTSPIDNLTSAVSAAVIEEPNTENIPADNLTSAVSAAVIEEPNTENIPADCLVSEMEQLRDNEGAPMFFYVQRKLDVVGSRDRKTWRGVGRAMNVSSDDLDLIETGYKAERSPTESLLAKFKTFTPEPTMREFVKALVICQRNDVARYICNCPWEKR